ncbi:Golgi-associated kinase 1B [Melanotaenia boesemani]|uniref:Golgi-associated kinase 1B n=1 Tax=Melanotaenia boesemani TaxID=1250792 RepID=UPI001C0565D1|nr:Golgi-associated kinase 1B [Melanotaenia boesemani]
MGKSWIHWLWIIHLKLTINYRRCFHSKRSLLIATICLVYLFFVVSHFGHLQQRRGTRTDEDKDLHVHEFYNLDFHGALPSSADMQRVAEFVVPTRSNVVYITLKSKRFKPAHIRGTIRPKLRKKTKRPKRINQSITQNKLRTLERDKGQMKFASNMSWKGTGDVDYNSVNVIHNSFLNTVDSQISSIRIYSQRAPPWFSARDLKSMRFLADAKVLRIKEFFRGDAPSLLIFEGETRAPVAYQKHLKGRDVCEGQCGIICSPVDNTEVFAFHLDRVLGLNRTLPAVSRKFSLLHDGQSCPVVSWDASLYPEGVAAALTTVKLTWGEYQSSLKQRCWYKNISPKPDSGCSTIHHYEWSKLALFDFLLQIHNRLDLSCCGFRPRQEDECVQLGHHAACGDPNNIQLANIINRDYDPRHLVFTNNKGFFDRNEDNLDFRLLEGIKEFPEQAVSVLRSRKLREKLLQSLFLDQRYWESQGGRHGIDKLIDVIERRAKVLLTYINAHGIKVITMDV